MIITKDFVFIHMPKTGGTFVHGVFKNVIADYKKDHPIQWYLNRIGFRMNVVKPIYQKFSDVAYYEYPGNDVKGQHAGISYIPKEFQKLPIISVKRNPIKKFISTYYFRWWERFPILPLSQLTQIFPHYPDITIEEYFELSYIHVMKHFFMKDYREDIGLLSWQFIRMYSSDPLYVYKNVTKANYNEMKESYFKEVRFFEMDQLASELEEYLKTTSFSKYSNFFKTEERIYPPGSNPKKRSESLSPELINTIKSKEWFLYKFFPEYNL